MLRASTQSRFYNSRIQEVFDSVRNAVAELIMDSKMSVIVSLRDQSDTLTNFHNFFLFSDISFPPMDTTLGKLINSDQFMWGDKFLYFKL